MERFGFLVHPLGLRDVERKFPFASRFSKEWVERFLRHAPPLVAGEMKGICGAGSQAEGWLIGVPLMPGQLLELPTEQVLRKIVAAGRKAEKLGARIIGLGALTSVVGDAGITVARQLSIPVTTGNSYTVATALQATCQAAGLMGIELHRARLCVVGATGAIGGVCARMMAGAVGNLTLVARDEPKLENLAGLIFSESSVLCDISTDLRKAVREADIVITVSAAAEELISPADLKSGAVVCDVARPRDVALATAGQRDDVLVIEGGLVQVPGGYAGDLTFGLPPGVVYACMAETMVLALERRYECFTLGRSIEIDQVREIDLLAKKHGFQLAGFRSFERSLSVEEVVAIRRRAEEKKERVQRAKQFSP
jgi:fatty aldehyde-generating acyl-ACP reductase